MGFVFCLLCCLLRALSSLGSLFLIVGVLRGLNPMSRVTHSTNRQMIASLCALHSSALGADPFLHHPALLGPDHPGIVGFNLSVLRSDRACLFSLLSSLFSLFSAADAAAV